VTKTESSRWQKLAAMPDAEFEQVVADAKREAVRSVEVTTAERAKEKRDRRDAREAALADRILALPDRKYGVIYADPEWRFEPWSRKTGMDRSADNHYSTSSLDVIKSRDVASIAAANCALFLCATRPMLPQALEVMEAWGFDYRTCAVWSKNKTGHGYWLRDRNELLLIGVKGDVPAPAMGDQWDSQVDAPANEHSAKPEAYFGLIEAYFPTVPKIELNARRRRPGWDAWGLEAPQEAGE
jgi:N6-adenosine-specific RNA methylase IME4